jgi:hypothetical protein
MSDNNPAFLATVTNGHHSMPGIAIAAPISAAPIPTSVVTFDIGPFY